MKTRKFAGVLVILMVGLFMTSCMSISKGLEPGQVVSEDSVFLIGSLDVGLTHDEQSSRDMFKGARLFLMDTATEKGMMLRLPLNETFLVKVPKANYKVMSLHYFTEVKGANTDSQQFMIEDTYWDLAETSVAYMGDVKFDVIQNPYGNYQNVCTADNNYESIVEETEGWILSEAGETVAAEDKSLVWDNSILRNTGIRLSLMNYKVKRGKNKTFIPAGENDVVLDKTKSIAFLSGDMNEPSLYMVAAMTELATTMGVNVIPQVEIGETLPLYPANIYESGIYHSINGNESLLEINGDKVVYYSAKDEDEYNSAVEPLIFSMGKKLDVDYIYLGYWVDGVDLTPQSGAKGFLRQNKNILYLGMRGRLFDIKSGEVLGRSELYTKDVPFFNYQASNERIESISSSLGEDVVSALYE
jgi:hypothetical protein